MAGKKQTSSNFQGIDTTQRFSAIDKFLGYRNREDKTLLPPGYMIEGSQNVLIDVSGRLKSSKGYTLDGTASSTLDSTSKGSYDWQEHKNGVINTKYINGELKFRYNNDWTTIKTGLSTTNKIRFTNYWDNTEKENVMLFVDGDTNVYEWNGANTTYASSTASVAGVITAIVATPTRSGSGYKLNDVLTITGGSGTATCKVKSLNLKGVVTYSLILPGTAYHLHDTITLNDTHGGRGATFDVTSIDGGGAITGLSLLNSGHDYVVSLAGQPVSGGNGTDATISINSIDSGCVASVELLTAGSGYSATSDIATTGINGTGCTIEVSTIATTATITKQGTDTWGFLGFYVAGNRKIKLNGVEYTYTGGWNSTTLTGVTPDPSLVTNTAGDLIYQSLITTASTSITDLPHELKLNGISMLDNQVYYGSETSNEVYVSKQNDYKSVSYTAPVRVVGEGALMTLRAMWKAFAPQEDGMYISAGTSQWYRTEKKISSDNSKEEFSVLPIKTSANQGAISQEAVAHDRNSVVFISHESRVVSLGRVVNIFQTPMLTDYSYMIVNDMNNSDFTNASLKYWKSYMYMNVPVEGKYYIYNMTIPDTKNADGTVNNNFFWEAPQTGNFSSFSIIGQDLYAHDYSLNQAYKMYDGYTYNTHPILSRAVFAYNSFGNRQLTKYHNEFWIDGYISANTTLKLIQNSDLDGCATEITREIVGNNNKIVCMTSSDASLGKVSLGKKGLGTSINTTTTDPLPPYFHVILQTPRKDYWFMSPVFESFGKDYHWEILSFGPLATMTMYGNNQIKT